ncbi:MAG: type II toxin-antitoxin system RelE/ParE family toxin [Steroidobacteraceae bacterium]
MKAVIWMGSSREDLRAFPADARRQAGYRLDKVQRGVEPEDWKPLDTIGQGVRELRIRESSGAFRVVYIATLPKGVYVLHCFQKKTQKTSRKDIRLAKLRFKALPGDSS